jgi:transcriptional antiterminator
MSLKEVAEALRVSKQSVLRGLEEGEGRLRKKRLKIEDLIS